MAIQLTSYSAFTSKFSALAGIDYSSMTASEQGFTQTFFDTNIARLWDDNSWLDVCPYGEARFAGNLLTYPNDLSKSSYWTATALTVTANNLSNPADGRVTASKCLETSANSAHSVSQSYTFIPNTAYTYTAYIRGNGRQYVQLVVSDGSSSFTQFFNVSAGTVGTASSNLMQSSVITQQNNGFWCCTIYFTTSATAAAGSFTTKISTDGSTVSYAGDATKGIWSWGQVAAQTSYADPTAVNVPLAQVGESVIDTVFQVWMDSPVGALNPRAQGYTLNPDNIQLIGPGGFGTFGYGYSFATAYPNGYNPIPSLVYLYYRKKCPDFSASAYDATATYAVDDQILFTNSKNVQNFWKCTVVTTAGQSPDTTATSWEMLEIPVNFLLPVVYGAYADWMRMDGQLDKASAMDGKSQEYQDDLADKQERQAGWLPPMKVQTHVTSQQRTY